MSFPIEAFIQAKRYRAEQDAYNPVNNAIAGMSQGALTGFQEGQKNALTVAAERRKQMADLFQKVVTDNNLTVYRDVNGKQEPLSMQDIMAASTSISSGQGLPKDIKVSRKVDSTKTQQDILLKNNTTGEIKPSGRTYLGDRPMVEGFTPIDPTKGATGKTETDRELARLDKVHDNLMSQKQRIMARKDSTGNIDNNALDLIDRQIQENENSQNRLLGASTVETREVKTQKPFGTMDGARSAFSKLTGGRIKPPTPQFETVQETFLQPPQPQMAPPTGAPVQPVMPPVPPPMQQPQGQANPAIATRIQQLRQIGMPEQQIAKFLAEKGIDPTIYMR